MKDEKQDWLSEHFEKIDSFVIQRYLSLSESTIRKLVPKGCYCYDKNGPCTFWEKWSTLYPEQSNGYCALLEKGDWMGKDSEGTFLLWDQCKECGINDDDESVYFEDENVVIEKDY